MGQGASTPYKIIRSQNDKPKWISDKLMHYIGQKRCTNLMLKAGEENLRSQYNELARTVKRLTKKTKSNYEINVASQAKTDPKEFSQVHKRKTREEFGSLKSAIGELVSSGEGICKIFNEYFLTVFIQEDMQGILDSEQIFIGEASKKLTDIPVTKEMVKKKDRL